jgi:hypothetical protein
MQVVQKVEIKLTNVEGVTEITSPKWNGRILRMSHQAYFNWCKSGTLPETPAVYVIYADHFDKQYGKELYIGHTSKIERRVDQHVADKPYWSVLLVFVSQKDWMNIAYTQNIEHRFIDWARCANRYVVKNGNNSAKTHLGAEDTKRLESFLDGVRTVLKLAGIDVFEFNSDGVFELIDTRNNKFLSRMRIEDRGEIKKVRILADSVIRVFDKSNIQNISGVSYDTSQKTCTFSEDVVLDVDMSLIPKVCGINLTNWVSPCGVRLSDILKN